jgi:hypothetical protein
MAGPLDGQPEGEPGDELGSTEQDPDRLAYGGSGVRQIAGPERSQGPQSTENRVAPADGVVVPVGEGGGDDEELGTDVGGAHEPVEVDDGRQDRVGQLQPLRQDEKAPRPDGGRVEEPMRWG